jgi:hyperosmotically inducible protein
MRSLRFTLVACATEALLCSAMALAPSTALAQSAPDNSAQNKSQTTTADNQPNAQADRTTTAAVRKALMADKGLSTYGHNVKIITKNGTVMLKGPVKSEEEKQKIAADVASVVSPDKITNSLMVKE